jgi:shikimate kinase
MNVILTGFMGTGKTAVGRRLAKRLGVRFVDADRLIEETAHAPIARIFAEHGEAVFRRLERRAVARVVHGRRQIIAVGGGAFMDPQSRSRLRASGVVVCLTARPRVLLARLGPTLSARPLLAGARDPLARIRTLLRQRAAGYAQADLTVETSDLTVEEVGERIWRALRPSLCTGWQYVQDHAQALTRRYGGQYIMVVDGRVVGSGDTQLEAYRNGCLRRDTRRRPTTPRCMEAQEAGIYYIPLPAAEPAAVA